MQVKINVLNENIKIPQDIIKAADGDELIARLFFNRGYKDPDTIRQMLHEELYMPVRDDEFPAMQEAVKYIVKALDNGDRIAVYGDYDVDGVTSTVTLVQCLRCFTAAVDYHVPDRFTEGYGMNSDVIRRFSETGVSLIITCDCGISNYTEINLAKELGMEVIVTDHHNIPEILPPADVILNPKLLCVGHRARNISGCGMAYFLCRALLTYYQRPEKADDFLDMLALSLVADVVSLNGENRYLLKRAMPKLFNTNRTGLKELFTVIERDSKLQNEEDIAFQIAPRINAAGRMDSAALPVELFLCENPLVAASLAEKIDFYNKERKRVQQDIIKQAIELVEGIKKNKTVLVLYGEFWHHGIIGIAAGKICETYRKPAILLSLKEDGVTVVGSARSTEDINIYELLKECSGKLIKFGGHSAAAGLSLRREDVHAFTEEIERMAEKKYSIKSDVLVNVDMELNIDEVCDELYNRICSAGPYGEGFEPPVFTASHITVVSDRKTEKNHHIMVLADENDTRIPAVKWFGVNYSLQDRVFDITYKIGRNTYRGNSNLQLGIEHFLESNGKPKRAFSGAIIDERRSDFNILPAKYPDAVFFYEGLSSACPVENPMNRYTIVKVETLVFVSAPVNTALFREIISLANPKKVVICFSVLTEYGFKSFITGLMGVVKHCVNNQGGRVQIENLAMKLGVEENILIAALKYLQAIGKVDYSIDKNMLLLYMSSRGQNRESIMLERRIRDALLEKGAYQEFLMKLEIDRFIEYLK